MAEILYEVPFPHGCYMELNTLKELWIGSVVRCSCGQVYRREDDQRGAYWGKIMVWPNDKQNRERQPDDATI